MELKAENKLLKKSIDEKLYQEKSITSDKMSDWFIKVIISFSVLRMLTVLVDGDLRNVQVVVSGILVLIFVRPSIRVFFKYFHVSVAIYNFLV